MSHSNSHALSDLTKNIWIIFKHVYSADTKVFNFKNIIEGREREREREREIKRKDKK